jgi:hypothetical protein
MKFAVLVIATDTDVLSFFNRFKASVVPKEVANGQHRFSVSVKEGSASDQEVADWLLKSFEKNDAVGILTEIGLQFQILDDHASVFRMDFCSHKAKANASMKNYFGHHLKRWLRNLIFLAEQFNDGKLVKCLLLPRQSFNAPELEELFTVCATLTGEGKFSDILQTNLKSIREKRSTPKKKKSGQSHFLRDDSGRYFELAKEKHGQSETTNPPHNSECILTATARFGVSIDREVHFNVSEEVGQISGEFVDCHGVQVVVQGTTHINMFPNGFIR